MAPRFFRAADGYDPPPALPGEQRPPRSTCGRWLDHLADQEDLRGHLSELPRWIRDLPASVNFDEKVARDAAAHVAAAVLGISVRSVYRGLSSS